MIWPINPQTPYPGTSDGKFPADWQYIFEPLETLTYVAANTENIALGTSVIDMLFQNPVIMARRFATLDVLSEGRTICGLGIGWSKTSELDLGQRTIRAVLKSQDGKIVNELKIKRQANSVLRFLKGTNANVVMESGYNYQYLYDLLKSEGYNVKVAHPLMVKAIAYAKVKTDKVHYQVR